MLNTIFPEHIDNVYHGRKAADGIPLDCYPAPASHTILAMFTISALSRFILCLLGIMALVCYRGAVVFVFVLLAIYYIGREIILYVDPIARTGDPVGPTVNFILFVITAAGLVLSLWPRIKMSNANEQE